MDVMFRSVCVSPHLNSFCGELFKRVKQFRFVYSLTRLSDMRRTIGWRQEAEFPVVEDSERLREEATCVDVLLDMLREIPLFEQRAKAGLVTFYASERWFKPPYGFLRMLDPRYARMAWRFARCVLNSRFLCLPMGVHAARDMARLCGFFSGDLCCLFRAPKVAFESRPGGVVVPLEQAIAEGCLDTEAIDSANRNGFVQIPPRYWGRLRAHGVFAKLRMWGYFVSPGQRAISGGRVEDAFPIQQPSTVLWVGRLLNLKRVGDLARACRPRPNLKRAGVSLHIYGHGPEEARLRKRFANCDWIHFHDFVPTDQVRELMHTYDAYVLPSNGYEGWGAVVSEALEEGMRVLATFESGSGATVLPASNLFHAGDVEGLAQKLRAPIPMVSIGEWTGAGAAKAFLDLLASFGENEVPDGEETDSVSC